MTLLSLSSLNKINEISFTDNAQITLKITWLSGPARG